jgi:hypothetical protein
MYPPMDHYSKARQDELLRTVGPGQSPSFKQVNMVRPKEQSFIRRLFGFFSRRKMQPTTDSVNYAKEYQELRQA